VPKSTPATESAPIDLPSLLADANCHKIAPDVQKRAKAAWKKNAPPDLFELVKTKLRALKRLEWEVSEQLEELDKAVASAKVSFDVPAFARAVYDRSQYASPPLGTAYLVARDVEVARERLIACIDVETKTLKLDFNPQTLTDSFFDALPAVRKHCAFESVDISVKTLTAHRLPELLKGVKGLELSFGDSMTTLPAELFTEELQWLTLYGRKLTQLPEDVGRARNVCVLDLKGPIKALPKALGTWPLITLSLDINLPKLDLSQWPTLKNAYLNGTIKALVGIDKLPALEDYTQRCGLKKVPDELWNVKTLQRVWIWFDGFDDFDDVKAKFEARGVRFAQS